MFGWTELTLFVRLTGSLKAKRLFPFVKLAADIVSLIWTKYDSISLDGNIGDLAFNIEEAYGPTIANTYKQCSVSLYC